MSNLFLSTTEAPRFSVGTLAGKTLLAAFGAGTGLLVAGPPGAIIGGVVGAVWGHLFWGPPNSPQACWIDNSFYRHCRYYLGQWCSGALWQAVVDCLPIAGRCAD